MKRAFKEKLKRLVPGFVVRFYHLVRVALLDLRFYAYHLTAKGDKVNCPICDQSYRSFLPGGENIPVLQEHQVSSAGYRKNCLCPNCRSKERDRLLFLFLLHETNFLNEPQRMLHFAPEPSLKPILSGRGVLEYIDADLDPGKGSVQMDITKIPVENDTFDVVICNHVLEHVEEDIKALTEIARILKVHGTALLQVPIAQKLESTYEDFSVLLPQDRELHFGQCDHVRIYGLDFIDRLKEAGFEVSIYEAGIEFPEELIRKYALLRNEKIYVCTKP